jgi:hypothetical protein
MNEIIINIKSAFAALAHVRSISPPTPTLTLIYWSNIAPSPQSYPSTEDSNLVAEKRTLVFVSLTVESYSSWMRSCFGT